MRRLATACQHVWWVWTLEAYAWHNNNHMMILSPHIQSLDLDNFCIDWRKLYRTELQFTTILIHLSYMMESVISSKYVHFVSSMRCRHHRSKSSTTHWMYWTTIDNTTTASPNPRWLIRLFSSSLFCYWWTWTTLALWSGSWLPVHTVYQVFRLTNLNSICIFAAYCPPIQCVCVSGTSNENQNCFVFDDEKVKSTTNTVSGIARTDRIVSVKSCHSLALLEFIQEIYINKLELKEVIGKAAIPIPYYCMCNNQLKFVWIPIFVFFLLCHNTPQHTIQKSTASFHLFRSEIHLLE